MLNLISPNDPILTAKAEKVVFPSTTIGDIANEMMETMVAYDGCGLAAPQVGIPYRIFVWRHGGGHGVVINPVIIQNGNPKVAEVVEGCLSFPGEKYRARRPSSIICNYFDVSGSRTGLHVIDGFKAVIFQHEYDHLVGRLLPHHAIREES